ncbi:carboxymuconolactone decarboxylase family protein [Streptomyces sp. I8-5]|uniref:carboxymuconolactone decarboxylase family protein n=1 Tax=Streptomyces sp. I8-5 TaxID=3104277 RepID=UPI003865DF98
MSTVNLGKQHPATYKNLGALDAQADTAAREAGLDPLLAELVRIRVSQLNGCAFCLRMHTRDALAKGESTDRLAVLAAWWESQYFTAQERAALALTEQVTELTVPERHTWDDGSLTDEQVSAVSWLAIVMNAWNRVAISSHYRVAPEVGATPRATPRSSQKDS